MKPDQIRRIAIEMVREIGLVNLSRADLCERCGIPAGSFPHYAGINFSEFVAQLRREGVSSPFSYVTKSRVPAELRRENLLETAAAVAEKIGFTEITYKAVAEAAGVHRTLVRKYFNTPSQLRREVMELAVRHENLIVLAQGIALDNEHAQAAPLELKEKAINSLLKG